MLQIYFLDGQCGLIILVSYVPYSSPGRLEFVAKERHMSPGAQLAPLVFARLQT
jgi:hypothetical protein